MPPPGSAGVNAIDTSIDRLKLVDDSVSSHKSVLLRELNVDRFEATFSVKRESSGTSDHGLGFVFNAKDQDSFDSVHLFHHDSAQVPLGWKQDDGRLMNSVAATTNAGNIPALTSSDTFFILHVN